MNLTLIVSLIIIFGMLFAFVYTIPIIFVIFLARWNGWEISWSEAKILKNNYCLKGEFLRISQEILEIEDVPVKKLCTFYLASGNMNKLKDGILKLKELNINYDIDTLIAIILANKNLDSIIEKIGNDRTLYSSTGFSDQNK